MKSKNQGNEKELGRSEKELRTLKLSIAYHRLGRKNIEKGNIKDGQKEISLAFQGFLALANIGDTAAMFNLGNMYIQEDVPEVEGVNRDVRAAFWYIVAAKFGDVDAKEYLKEELGIDIDDDLNEYAIVPVAEIDAFLAHFETHPGIIAHHYTTFLTPQEVAAMLEGLSEEHHISAATGVATYSSEFAAAAAAYTEATPAHHNTTHGGVAAGEAHDPSMSLAGLHATGAGAAECG